MGMIIRNGSFHKFPNADDNTIKVVLHLFYKVFFHFGGLCIIVFGDSGSIIK